MRHLQNTGKSFSRTDHGLIQLLVAG